MAQMIDDLLSLSRATRTELHRGAVDVTGLANGVLAELRAAQPHRRVDTRIAAGLAAAADADLIRLVLQNLLANAWKFTANRPQATIEMDREHDNGQDAFYVRDNGAGFDPRFASKLFEPFQRLHASSEFEGNGIGLAIVHRIVTRHGGRIWADGAVGHGSVFRFTLAPGYTEPTRGEPEQP
jgi:signal transduction histidine kinase